MGNSSFFSASFLLVFLPHFPSPSLLSFCRFPSSPGIIVGHQPPMAEGAEAVSRVQMDMGVIERTSGSQLQ